jgi:hypothetical protein
MSNFLFIKFDVKYQFSVPINMETSEYVQNHSAKRKDEDKISDEQTANFKRVCDV